MIAVVDYGLGNLLSVCKALEEVADSQEVVLSRRREDLARATHLILPGAGNFRTGMRNLRDFNLLEPLREAAFGRKKPLLGICLGMQLMAEMGEESGEIEGMGWISGRVQRLNADGLKLPHIGWNELVIRKREPLFQNVRRELEVYFVHGYRMSCPEEYVSASCDYGETFPAAIQKDNLFAVQFHPEKSRESGLQILRNFLSA